MSARFAHAPVPNLVRYSPWFRAHLPIRLARADRERLLAVFPVVHVAQIRFDFARPEELVRWRKKCQRSTLRFQNRQSIARLQTHGILIYRSSKRVLLPSPRRVAPHHFRIVGDCKSLQPAPRTYRQPTARSFSPPLPAATDSCPDIRCIAASPKNPRLKSWERHLDPCPIRLHRAACGVILRPRFANLLGLPR